MSIHTTARYGALGKLGHWLWNHFFGITMTSFGIIFIVGHFLQPTPSDLAVSPLVLFIVILGWLGDMVFNLL